MGPLGELLGLAAPYVPRRWRRQAGFVDSWAELHPDRARRWAGQFAIDDPQSDPLHPAGAGSCSDAIESVPGQ
jgi:hypothetical protein